MKLVTEEHGAPLTKKQDEGLPPASQLCGHHLPVNLYDRLCDNLWGHRLPGNLYGHRLPGNLYDHHLCDSLWNHCLPINLWDHCLPVNL